MKTWNVIQLYLALSEKGNQLSRQTLCKIYIHVFNNLIINVKCFNHFLLLVTNNYQEIAYSTIDTNSVHSNEHETEPILECKNVSIKRKSEEPENSGACFAKEHAVNENQFEKRAVTSSETPDILVNQLHKNIAEMKNMQGQGFQTGIFRK